MASDKQRWEDLMLLVLTATLQIFTCFIKKAIQQLAFMLFVLCDFLDHYFGIDCVSLLCIWLMVVYKNSYDNGSKQVFVVFLRQYDWTIPMMLQNENSITINFSLINKRKTAVEYLFLHKKSKHVYLLGKNINKPLVHFY